MRKATLAIFILLGVMLILAACGGDLDSGGGDDAGRPADGDAGGADGNVEEPSGDSSVSSDAGSAGGQGLPGVVDRKIVRTADLEVTVDNVAEGMADVERIASNAGGFVSESQLITDNADDDDERRQSATVTIRVPAENYSSVVSQLRGIAEDVTSENSNASEVTEEYTDLESRLRTLEATEDQYLELLSRAETIPDILTVQDRLNGVREEIERVQGRLNLLDDLSDLATITVHLELPAAAGEQAAEGKGWAQEAWDTSWEASVATMKVLGTIAIAIGVVAIWLAVPGVLALAAWRFFGQRRAGRGAA